MQYLLSIALLSLLSSAVSAQVSNINTVAWGQVPGSVQQAILLNAGGTPPATVERGLENGQPIYSLTRPEANGQTVVVVRENGVIVDPSGAARPQEGVVAAAPTAPTPTNTPPEGSTVPERMDGQPIQTMVSEGQTQTSQIQVTPNGQVLSTTQITPNGTVQMQKIPLTSLPPLVARAVETQSGPGRIIDVVFGSYNGQYAYDIVYDQFRQRIRLRVAENGMVLNQSILSTLDERAIPVEPYIGYSQVPVAVQTTLSAIAGDASIESVTQEVVNGRITYVGRYQQNGSPVFVRLSQTGQLLR